jgi:uncharacterized membrane protein
MDAFSYLISQPERFFGIIALLGGLLFIIIVPPFQTPDENVHFYRAYEVSELKTPSREHDGRFGSMLPASIRITEARVHGLKSAPDTPGQIMFNAHEKYSFRYTKSALFDIPLNAHEKIFYATAGSPAYVSFSYLPQAFIVGVARLFDAPIIVMLYLVRFINLALWIALGFLAIKLFPWRKWALAGVCLLPLVVSQSISPGLDATILGATLLFLALIFRTLADATFVLKRNLITLLALAIIMVIGKSVLWLLLPLVFLIDNAQLKVKRPLLAKLAIGILPLVIYILWGLIFRNNTATADTSNASQQTHQLIQYPLHFIHLLFNSLFLITPSGSILWESLIGNFGWLDTPLAPLFVDTGFIVLAILLLANYDNTEKSQNKPIALNQIVIISLIAIMYILVVFLAMYLYFTPPNSNHIKGVNGRYLIPVYFLLLPLGLKKIIIMKCNIFVNFVRVSSLLLLAGSILTIIFRYYIIFVPN